MAIDAVIERIRTTDRGLRLELAPRYMPDVGYDSCAGQPALTIEGPRVFEPRVGDAIWGGAGECEIVAERVSGNVRRSYRRLGYTGLQERLSEDGQH